MIQERVRPSTDVCPDCPDSGVRDGDELVCPACGLVLHDAPQAPRHDAPTGSPVTRSLPDKGLSTSFDIRDSDRRHDHRAGASLETWQYRLQRQASGERTLDVALDELDRLTTTLGLPTVVERGANRLVRRAVDAGLVVGWSIEAIATATVYLVARDAGYPRSLAEVARVSHSDERTLGRAYRHLATELDVDLPPPDPRAFVARFCSRLALDADVERRAREYIDRADSTVLTGKQPDGIAAGAVYLAANEAGECRCLDTVADAARVGVNTVSKRSREFRDDVV